MVSRNVIFHEKKFPFHASQQPKPLFPIFYLPTSTCDPTLLDHIDDSTNLKPTDISNPNSTRHTSTSHPIDDSHASHGNTSPISSNIPASDQHALRRSTRQHHPPQYLSDYVCQN